MPTLTLRVLSNHSPRVHSACSMLQCLSTAVSRAVFGLRGMTSLESLGSEEPAQWTDLCWRSKSQSRTK